MTSVEHDPLRYRTFWPRLGAVFLDAGADIEQPLTGRHLIQPTDLFPKQAKEFGLPFVQPCNQVVDLAWHGHADAMNPLKPLADPPQGRPRSRLVDLVRHRLPLARQLVAP